MKRICRFLAFGVAISAPLWLPILVFIILMGPVHNFVGRRNTVYSSRFTADHYARIAVGTTREKVIELLGAPFQRHILDTNYPPWSEGIECLTFSLPKKLNRDYDEIEVWIGADKEVRRHTRWVTD